MKKAIMLAVLWTAALPVFGQFTQSTFSAQVFDPKQATKANWSVIPSFTTWRNVIKNASKGQPVWGYMRFEEVGPYLKWGDEHWYKAYYSPDAKNLYSYNSGMTRGQKVTVRVLFPGTYYIYFQDTSTLLRLDVTSNQVITNLYTNK